MREDEMDQFDNETMNILIDKADQIDDIYIKLFDYEKKHLKDSVSYKKAVKYLKIILEEEEGLYKEIGCLDHNKIKLYIEAIAFKDINLTILANFEDPKSYEKRSLKRVLVKLNDTLLKDIRYIKKDMASNLLPLNFPLDIISELVTKTTKLIKLQRIIETDFFSAVLYFMQNNINEKVSVFIKEKFLDFKYKTSFFNSIIETYLLDNDFAIIDSLCFFSKYAANRLGIKEEEYTKEKENNTREKVKDKIIDLLYLSDYKNSDYDIQYQSMYAACFLRASFMLVDYDEGITKSIINDIGTILSAYPNEKQIKRSIDIINNVLKNIDNDKIKRKVNYIIRTIKPLS